MVIVYHLIWMAYGWWLPNDPRGSNSKNIKRDVLKELGELHHGRKRAQPCSQIIRDFYKDAADILKDELLTFTPREIEIIANSFSTVISEQGYTCYGCAIMPDHVHMVIRKHKHLAEEMIEHLQFGSRHELLMERMNNHPVWGGPGWKVFLDSPEDVRRTINMWKTIR